MTRDQHFFIAFAKMATLLTYMFFHVIWMAIILLMIFEPPTWLTAITHSPTPWLILSLMLGFVFINFLFIPIAISLARHEGMEVHRRQLIYYTHRDAIDKTTTDNHKQNLRFIERDNNNAMR